MCCCFIMFHPFILFSFFFNDTATTEIYTLSLHDALPISRWKIEETFRFVKQSYPLEDIRVMRYQRLKNLVLLMTAAAYFATAFLGQKLKLKILCEKLLIKIGRASCRERV